MNYILRASRLFLRLELRRLERRMFLTGFDAALSERLDRVRAALDVLQ
jgi:hypothetical protein